MIDALSEWHDCNKHDHGYDHFCYLCKIDAKDKEIERLTAENERLLILKKACENWMDICGCCCESDTESLHDGTRITQLGIKDALDSLQDKNTSTSEQVQVSLTP